MKRLNLRPARARPRLGVAAALVVLALLLTLVVLSTSIVAQTQDAFSQRQRLEGETAALARDAAQAQTNLQLAVAARRALSELQQTQVRVDLLRTFESALPDGLWFTSMAMSPALVRASGASLGWQTVAAFVDALRDAGVAVRVQTVSRTATRIPMYRFVISVTPPSLAAGVRP